MRSWRRSLGSLTNRTSAVFEMTRAMSPHPFAILALLSLASCGPTKQQITSQCDLDALNYYSAKANANVQLIAHHAETCMQAHSYKFDPGLPGCTAPGVSELVIAGEAMCYRPDRRP
jgi:hypothetical protein